MSCSPMGSLVMSCSPMGSLVMSCSPMESLVMSCSPMGSFVMSCSPMESLVMSCSPMGRLMWCHVALWGASCDVIWYGKRFWGTIQYWLSKNTKSNPSPIVWLDLVCVWLPQGHSVCNLWQYIQACLVHSTTSKQFISKSHASFYKIRKQLTDTSCCSVC